MYASHDPIHYFIVRKNPPAQAVPDLILSEEGAVNVTAEDLDFSGREDEAILLCTDGLTNEVSDSELQSIIEGEGSLKEKVTKLIDTANSRRGADNITALVIFPFADSDEVEL